ncbi:MAG: hydroxylamine reductase, partial [Bacillota bacterium]
MGMFCYQCQETARGTGCEYGGVCGKSEELADLQDLLIYTLKGISEIVVKGRLEMKLLSVVNYQVLKSLFMTITNANFDDEAILEQIKRMIAMRDDLRKHISVDMLHDAATFQVNSMQELTFKASYAGYNTKENEDIRSLRHLITFGIKGLAAYMHHALQLGKEKDELYAFVYEALSATIDDGLSVDALVSLTLKTGQYGVMAMALLDEGNTGKYGNPEITEVNIGVRNNPGILVSGHDLT